MWLQREPPAELETIPGVLGEDHLRTRRKCGGEPENDGPDRRTGDDVVGPPEALGDGFPQGAREAGVLEHAELLDEDVRVAAGGQMEVTPEDGPAVLQLGKDLALVQKPAPPDTSARIALAAARGSGASVMGRPITM